MVFNFAHENNKIMAAFRGMHVSSMKHSYARLLKSVIIGQTDRQKNRQTDSRRTKWYISAAMLRRWHNKDDYAVVCHIKNTDKGETNEISFKLSRRYQYYIYYVRSP